MRKILLSILILILYINSNAQSPLRINKYLIDSLAGNGFWYLYHDSTHTGDWGIVAGSGGGGAGTVTSVAQSFTGGLISVAGSPITTSGTLALTVAGTSGGIPYFSSTSTWASSGLLTANAIMIGGGAGTAPSTTTTGTGVLTALGINTGSAGSFVVFNGAGGTPSSITLTNGTGLPISTGVSGLGTGVATALAVNTGSAGAVLLFNGALGTPSSGTLTNATGLPPTTGIVGWPANSAGVLTNDGAGVLSWGAGGSTTWNGIGNPTGDQALTFDAGESSTWTNSNTTEDLFTANSSTVTTSSFFSLNRTSTALGSGNNIMELVSSGANGSSSITSTALRISNTNTGTSSVNEGINVITSGASNNYAILAQGRVGISTPTVGAFAPAASLTIRDADAGVTSFLIEGTDGTDRLIVREYGTILEGFTGTMQMYNSFGGGSLQLGGGNVGNQISMNGTRVWIQNNKLVLSQGADVASAAGAITLGNGGNSFEITGTDAITLISNLGWNNGSYVTLLFTSTATLTDGTANSGTDIGMELAGNTNFVASAGATLTLVLSEIGGTQRWREVSRSVQ